MPLILQNPIVLELLKLWATLCVAFVFCPLFILAIVCIFFSFFLLLPFVCSVIWAVFLWKILFVYPIRFFEMKFINFYSAILIKRKKPKCGEMSRNEDDEAASMKEKQMSLELDPMEFPCHFETDEDDDEAGKLGEKGMIKNGFCTFEEDSWQILVPKSIKIMEEYKPVRFVFQFFIQNYILLSCMRSLMVKD